VRTLELTNDDITLENGDFKLISESYELIQGLERRLTTMLSEFFLEPDMGLDYDVIKRKNPDVEQIRDAVGLCLTQEQRVLSIDDISVDIKTDRTVIISFKATTTLGEIESEVVG
jgi:hypothetical protein